MKNRLPVFPTQNVVFTVSLFGNRILVLGYLPVTCEVTWKKGYQKPVRLPKNPVSCRIGQSIRLLKLSGSPAKSVRDAHGAINVPSKTGRHSIEGTHTFACFVEQRREWLHAYCRKSRHFSSHTVNALFIKIQTNFYIWRYTHWKLTW